MNKKKAVIFTGGLGPDKQKIKDILNDAALMVAADSGWDLAVGMGIKPDIFIGDMDSVKDHAGISLIDDENILTYPEEKDYTDTELAIKYVEDNDYCGIVLVGGAAEESIIRLQ